MKQKGCCMCRKTGHKKASWYMLLRNQTWRSGKYFLKRSWFGKMWITKKDIYPTFDQPPEAENHLYNHVFIT